MKRKSLLYAAPLLLVSVWFAVVALRFKQRQRRAEATRELVQLCMGNYDETNLQRAVALLRAGANPNAQTPDGDPVLMITDEPLTRKLLAMGGNIDARDITGRTDLMRNAHWYMTENTARSRFLLKCGANPNLKDDDGNTALLIASQQCGEARWCNAEIARMLLAKGAQVDVCAQNGDTPLCRVASLVGEQKVDDGDSIELVRLLLAYGADPQHSNKKGETPLLLMSQQRCGIPEVDKQVKHAITMLQNAIKRRERVKSPRT